MDNQSHEAAVDFKNRKFNQRRPIWGVEVDVVDERHDRVPTGKEGEIRVRGPLVCQGYYNNPEAEGIDGWCYSGDIGRFDRMVTFMSSVG